MLVFTLYYSLLHISLFSAVYTVRRLAFQRTHLMSAWQTNIWISVFFFGNSSWFLFFSNLFYNVYYICVWPICFKKIYTITLIFHRASTLKRMSSCSGCHFGKLHGKTNKNKKIAQANSWAYLSVFVPCALQPHLHSLHPHPSPHKIIFGEEKGERGEEREERGERGEEKKWGTDAALWANLRNNCWCISYWLFERSW